MQENTFTTPEAPQGEPAFGPVKQAPTVKPPFFTFNINTILVVILLVGMAVLYGLYFSRPQAGGVVMPAGNAGGAGLRVVFVNTDTLNVKYEFLNDMRKELESHGTKLQNEVLSEEAALQKEANDFQRLVQGNVVTEERAGVLYQNLMKKQQALEAKKANYTQEIAEKEYNLNMRLLDTLNAFLKRFNAIYHYDYILGYKTAGEVLVANDTLDITPVVIDALNKEYSSGKK